MYKKQKHMSKSKSYYDILGIPKKASDAEIKRAYLALAKKHHPDQNPQNRSLAAKRFKLISEAYQGLETREKRAMYNQKLRLAAENDNTGGTGLFSNIGSWLRPQARATQETRK